MLDIGKIAADLNACHFHATLVVPVPTVVEQSRGSRSTLVSTPPTQT
jgi:hypothetical protein